MEMANSHLAPSDRNYSSRMHIYIWLQRGHPTMARFDEEHLPIVEYFGSSVVPSHKFHEKTAHVRVGL